MEIQTAFIESWCLFTDCLPCTFIIFLWIDFLFFFLDYFSGLVSHVFNVILLLRVIVAVTRGETWQPGHNDTLPAVPTAILIDDKPRKFIPVPHTILQDILACI